MTSGQVAQDSVGSEFKVPRHGSIYDRLDKARAQRVRSLSPQVAANDAPSPSSASGKPRARSKSQLLPVIKSQDEFDPPSKQGLPLMTKLGLGVLAFSIMAGLPLLDWGKESLPAGDTVPIASDTHPRAAGEPTGVLAGAEADRAALDSPAVIPDAVNDLVVIEIQQSRQSLNLPASHAQDGSAQP